MLLLFLLPKNRKTWQKKKNIKQPLIFVNELKTKSLLVSGNIPTDPKCVLCGNPHEDAFLVNASHLIGLYLMELTIFKIYNYLIYV